MRLLFTVISVLALTSCAGIFKGTSQSVTFNTSPEGAEVIIDGQSRGVTPLTVKLKKNKYDTVMLKKAGYKTTTLNLEKSYDGVALLNVFWDSSTTDLITGAAYEYEPNSFFSNLSKEDPKSAQNN